MNIQKNRVFLFGVITMLTLSTITPSFAQVTSLQTNSENFFKGDKIIFSGTVEEGTTGLVSIVIKDLNDEFVVLLQTLINHDYSFEKTLDMGEKFTTHGIYNSTGFIINMAKGVNTEFGVSLNGIPVIQKETEIIPVIETSEKVEKIPEPTKEITKEHVKENSINTIANFVDPNKDPQHYIDRYYNELIYKTWFDKNYPELTIEKAVGYMDNTLEIQTTVQEIIDKEIIPEAEAVSIVNPTIQQNDNSDIVQVSLGIVGLVSLFAAVYGVKRKVDDNSKRISINRESIRQKFIRPLIGSNPKDILQIRLAKGEITLEEYEKIKLKFY